MAQVYSALIILSVACLCGCNASDNIQNIDMSCEELLAEFLGSPSNKLSCIQFQSNSYGDIHWFQLDMPDRETRTQLLESLTMQRVANQRSTYNAQPPEWWPETPSLAGMPAYYREDEQRGIIDIIWIDVAAAQIFYEHVEL